MTAPILRQFRLLLWKNFNLRRRRPVLFVLEILAPVVIVMLLAVIRTRNLRENMEPCLFQKKPMPSAGTANWLLAGICNFNNTCFNHDPPSDIGPPSFGNLTTQLNSFLETLSDPKTADAFDDATNAYNILRDLSNNATSPNVSLDNVMENSIETRNQLEENWNITFSDKAWSQLLTITVMQFGGVTRDLSDNSICNSTVFINNAEINNLTTVDKFQEELCYNLTLQMRRRFRFVILAGLDPQKLAEYTNFDPFGNSNLITAVERLVNSTDIFSSLLNGFTNLNSNLNSLSFSMDSNNDTNFQLMSFAKQLCGEKSDLYRVAMIAASEAEDKKRKRKKRSVDDYEKESHNVCKDIYARLSDGAFKIFFNLFRNVMFGHIYYTPVNQFTQAFMEKANYTFAGIGRLQTSATDWRTQISPDLQTMLTNSSEIDTLRDLLKVCYESSSVNPDQRNSCRQIFNFLSTEKTNSSQSNWVELIDSLDSLFANVEMYLSCFEWNKIYGINEPSLIDMYIDYDPYIWAGIIFEGLPENSTNLDDITHISVKIRMENDEVDSTLNFKVLDRTWSPGPRRNPYSDFKYFTYGLIQLQEMIGKGIIETLTNMTVDYSIQMQQFPYPCYLNDKFTQAVAQSLPLFMVLGWIFSVSMTVRAIVYEKEKRLKEIMKVMGLSNGMHWLGWFTTSMIITTFSALIITFLLKIVKILPFASPTLLFFVIWSFVVASIMQCFLISVFFGRANIAATVAGLLYFVFYLPYAVIQVNIDTITQGPLYGLSLLAQVSLSLSCQYFAAYEQNGLGIQWNNVWISPSVDDPFCLGKCMIMFWVDAFLYGLLTWYIESVFPGQFGVPRVWYFPFTRSYWCGEMKTLNVDTNTQIDQEMVSPLEQGNSCIEKEPTDLTIGVSIRNMFKRFGKSKKPAVDGLNLNFYEGQITSFLGHNGAGKTTTMSILTGLFTPTSGTAYVYGRNIATEMDEIRHDLGLCPQHNVLFDFLTVEEHIYFYGLLKGVSPSQIEKEMTHYVNAVGLPHKRKELSGKLSGGMKRKLSVAMAFVGGSRLVILDEPTAGVDPYARRSIWELVGSCRSGRTLILTTHHMDEADVLGDRVAIIARGKLRCSGSSVFLKRVFGTGYNLVLAKINSSIASETKEMTQRLIAYVQSRVEGSHLADESITEWLFKLPLSGLDDGSFSKLLRDLDVEMAELGVESYGLADTSLEEVFLRVADDPDDDFTIAKDAPTGLRPVSEESFDKLTDDGALPRPVSSGSLRSRHHKRRNEITSLRTECPATDSTIQLVSYSNENTSIKTIEESCNGAGSTTVTGFSYLCTQFVAVWVKRFHNLRRNKKGFVAEMVVPPLFVLLAVGITSLVPGPQENPPMELHPWHLSPKRDPRNLHVFYANLNQTSTVSSKLASSCRSVMGSGGVRCMNSSIYTIDKYACVPTSNFTQWSPAFSGIIPSQSPDCDCSQIAQICSDPLSGGPPPSVRLMSSTDNLYNLTGYNITDYLLKTDAEFLRKRYGGFTFNSSRFDFSSATTKSGIREFRLSMADNSFIEGLLLFTETMVPSTDEITIWFNNKGYVASVGYLGILQNLILRQGFALTDQSNKGISFISHPLNMTYKDLIRQSQNSMNISVLLAICVIFALAFIPASFLLFLIDERISNAKHLQLVSGLNPYVYWIANYMWDILNYILPCFICIVIFLAFQLQAYISRETVFSFILLMMLYGFAVIPMMYPASFVFTTPSAAFVVVSSVNLVLGLITTLAVYIVGLLENDDLELQAINDILKLIFLFFPQYCLGKGLMDLSYMQIRKEIVGTEITNPLEWDKLGKNVMCLAIETVVLFALILLIERGCGDCSCCALARKRCQCGKKKAVRGQVEDFTNDDDVISERERVLSGGADSDAVKIDRLTKDYPGSKLGRPAVQELCLGVRRGECFGLLGVNGAGKTTTFKMLTGHHSATSGQALVDGVCVTGGRAADSHRNVGYCPQFDALNPLLTGRETLGVYARLRRVPGKDRKRVVDWALSKLRLEAHADKICGAYSGGNKRKLSTAVALIGNPTVILLDEPTSGMDAGAKRFLWNCLTSVVQEGRSVLLTTHSMEECEALCHRLTVMVNGRLKCLGSVQHLKNKFGEGYTVSLKLSNDNPRIDEAKEYMSEKMPSCILKECNYTLIQYTAPPATPLADLLDALQGLSHLVDRYSVSQISLDQVFIDFAKSQTDLPTEEVEIPPAVDGVDNPLFTLDETVLSTSSSSSGIASLGTALSDDLSSNQKASSTGFDDPLDTHPHSVLSTPSF